MGTNTGPSGLDYPRNAELPHALYNIRVYLSPRVATLAVYPPRESCNKNSHATFT